MSLIRTPVLVGDPRTHRSDTPLPRDQRDVVWLALGEDRVGLWPIHPDDKPTLLEVFGRLSDESRYRRFLSTMDHLSARQVRYLTEVDHVNHFAWVAGTRTGDGETQGLGIARFVRLAEQSDSAEFAVAVADDSQGRGVGTLLVHALSVVAHDHGILELSALCLGENRPMIRILERLGGSFAPESPGVLSARYPLPVPVDLDPGSIDALLWVSRVAAHPPGS